MILDTTYFLPLARIGIDTDVLRAVAERKTDIKTNEIRLSLISIFELQAKAARLNVSSKFVNEAIHYIMNNFTVKPFSGPKVTDLSFELRKEISDYIDCIIVATAAESGEHLLTEDTRIWQKSKAILENYGVEVVRYRTVLLSS